MKEINEICIYIFNVLSNIAYWLIAFISLKEVLKSAAKHDTDGIIKALAATAISYIAIFSVVIILNMIKGVMGK